MSTFDSRDDSSLPHGKRVLLLNSPAVDVRLPWYKWHQPTGLLQIGAALRRRDCDVKFADFLVWGKSDRAPKSKVGSISLPDAPEVGEIDLWRFGASDREITKYFDTFADDWSPDIVFVTCGITSWWFGAQNLIRLVNHRWQNANVILGGAYPTYAPEHAAQYSGANQVVAGRVTAAADEWPDLTLYPLEHRPRFTGLYLYQYTEQGIVPRPPEHIATEFRQKAELGVTTFTFLDEKILVEHKDHFAETLQLLGNPKLDKAGIVITGNLSPDVVDARIAHSLKAAKCRQIYLHCDVAFTPNGMTYETPNEIYAECVKALQSDGGYKSRTDQITAMLMVGAPYEQIEEVTERLIRLASVVGAVNLIQYQHAPTNALFSELVNWNEGDPDSLTQLNCKLYPLSRAAGTPFSQYIELTRLAALLNSKYRSTTFDFLGDSLTAKMMRNSLRTASWLPNSPNLNGSKPVDEVIPLLPVDLGDSHDHQG